MLFAAMASVVLTSCVNEDKEVMESASKKAISFDMPVMKPTRAAGEIDGTTYPVDETFKAFCKSYTGTYTDWTTGADYFNAAGEDVALIGGNWSTTPVHYWPELGNKLAFAAYSPAVLGNAAAATQITRTDAGIQIADFVSEPQSDKQYDLMYSQTVFDRNKSNNASSAVSLKFAHALSSIVFSSQKSDAAVGYKITDLEVTGTFVTEGDFNQGIVGSTSAENVYTETESPVWSDLKTSSVIYDPTFNAFEVPAATPEIFTQGTSAILAIPQGVPTDAKVIVTYEKTTNNTTTEHVAEIFLKDFKKAAAEGVTVADGIDTWERGKRYVYRIAFGENQRIYFEPSVTDWVQEPTLIYTIK